MNSSEPLQERPGAHTFVVPAYGESVYLEACLRSLASQSASTGIVVCTSTPFSALAELCSKYDAKLVVHGPNRGIANDWNVALDQADTDWVTIAHQDDIYLPGFVEKTMSLVQKYPDAMLTFTGYAELGIGGVRPPSFAMAIKRILIELALLGRRSVSARALKRNLFRFGCPIGCPTVSLRLPAIPRAVRFDPRYRVNLDWDFWLRLASELPGAFACEREVLMHHRIHEGSETTAAIVDGVRAKEDYELFGRIWPKPITGILARAYRLSYSFNRS